MQVRKGCEVVLLTDRLDDMEVNRPPIPSLLAVGAVHHHLIRSAPAQFPLWLATEQKRMLRNSTMSVPAASFKCAFWCDTSTSLGITIMQCDACSWQPHWEVSFYQQSHTTNRS